MRNPIIGLIVLLFLWLFTACFSEQYDRPNELLSADQLDCGISPYYLADNPFSSDNHLAFKLRFVVFKEYDDQDEIHPKTIRRAFRRLNQDFTQLNMDFHPEVSEVIHVVDRDAYYHMINYHAHASKYNKRGYITILVYPDLLEPAFAGAAVAIPSTALAIKEFYLTKSTISHEMFHVFGGYHSHTPDNSERKASFMSGDFICDTPNADTFAELNPGYTGVVDENCNYVGPDNGLSQEENNKLIRNISSYSLVECRVEFTEDQSERVRFIIATSTDLKETAILGTDPVPMDED